MSLSPFDSFQSRFVTYLLIFPHNKQLGVFSFIVQSASWQIYTTLLLQF